MDSKESALQILLAVADRLQLPRKCKFLALTVFTDRYESLISECPAALTFTAQNFDDT